MNNSGLWLTWTTLGYELRALDAMNSRGLWMIYKRLEVSWAYDSRFYEQLKALNDINDSSL